MRYRGSRPVKGISHQLERLLHLVRMLLHLFDDLPDVSIMNDDPSLREMVDDFVRHFAILGFSDLYRFIST
jgi:hypothetical protein